MPMAEPCYGPPPAAGCPPFAAFLVNGSCCTLPPAQFLSAPGGMQTARVAVASVPSVPALPTGALALAGLSLLGVGATRRGRRPTSSRGRDPRRAGGLTVRRG
jgi:hypothetical protein